MFLWVRLVLDDLLNDLMEGASPEELYTVLAKLPDGLEELCVPLVKRIEPDFHGEGHIMLEIVLRNDGVLGLRNFWDAEQSVFRRPGAVSGYKHCGKDFTRINQDMVRARIRSRCGGLVELVRIQRDELDVRDIADDHGYKSDDDSDDDSDDEFDSGSDSVLAVQLMQQTTKEFLLRPEASRLFLAPDDSTNLMNGYSFLAQYHLTRLTQLVPPKQSVGGGPDILRHVILCAGYGRGSEMSTGRSLESLLSSVEYERYRDFLHFNLNGICTSEMLVSGHSRLSFAVVADMRIYVRAMIQKHSLGPLMLGQLLHCLSIPYVLREVAPGLTDPKTRSFSPIYSSAYVDMAKLLLDSTSAWRTNTPTRVDQPTNPNPPKNEHMSRPTGQSHSTRHTHWPLRLRD